MDSSVKQVYVLGFAFTEDKRHVLLIQKRKPEWQAGKFNGIGGKVEEFEGYRQAMVREFFEETGIKTTIYNWLYAGSLKGGSWHVEVLKYTGDEVLTFSSPAKDVEGEVFLIPVENLNDYPVIPNLKWLIPYALDSEPYKMKVDYL